VERFWLKRLTFLDERDAIKARRPFISHGVAALL
jgi:hypothetical protein